ncbi:hypothetical protein F7230_01610 [Corynebacterium sp. 320]|nr:hypothetical protein F7230_01610 [Corynebacterium sp. 320]KAB1553064.1 hypothetical protein F7233_04975 [Corynebacterium sp. 321]KAB1553716.1 hypothetical protein F7232_01605 [Corynebacterium sp. 319]KAB3527971.1 hypothetical protein F8354_01610 [Corynebacterium sp. 250]KAB3540539.1 hypothetical protein F8390_04720 [Corynebacterium sp. 366]
MNTGLYGARMSTMLDTLRSLSLVSTPITIVSWVCIILGLIGTALIVPSGKRLKTIAIAWGISIGIALAVVLAIELVLKMTFDELKPIVILAITLCGCCLLTFAASIFMHWRSLLGVAPLALSLIGTLLLANQAYVLYPTVHALETKADLETATVDDLPAALKSIPLPSWKPPRSGLRDHGVLVRHQPPAPASGFNSRDAVVYLPPAWFSEPRPQLPVLVLMPGSPGDPEQWFANGHADELADRYQRQHGGLAPIIASIDTTGSTFGNPLCTDSPEAKITTFVAEDVPIWLKKQFNAAPDQHTWTLGGMSYGGTCALQTILNRPEAYGTFLDFSGEISPNDGLSHQSTVSRYFDGSQELFDERNPESILTRSPHPDLVGHFVAGKDDDQPTEDLKRLNELAQRAGANTTFTIVDGGHDFEAWRQALEHSFSLVISRGGLPT